MLSVELTEEQVTRLEELLQAHGETALLAAVVTAQRRTQGLVQCVGCGTWFAGDGRAHYHSAACKQKAYRQRKRDWRRKWRPDTQR